MERVGLLERRLQFLVKDGSFEGWPLGVLIVELQRWHFKSLVWVKVLVRIMFEAVSLFLVGLVLGLAAVAANPSPYFAALGLVVVAGIGCGVLVGNGGPFLSLILFLIYLGGMLVVFAYSAALAAEPYPEGWFSGPVALYIGLYVVGVGLASIVF